VTSVCWLDFFTYSDVFVGASVVENDGLHVVDDTTGLVPFLILCLLPLHRMDSSHKFRFWQEFFQESNTCNDLNRIIFFSFLNSFFQQFYNFCVRCISAD
jgi:hypothetical protein